MRSFLSLVIVAVLLPSFCSNIALSATLVARWDFENAGNLGLDSSGANNNGTITGTVTQVNGRMASSRGAHFDFSKIVIGPMAGYTGAGGVTLAAWVNRDAADGSYDGIISQDTGGCCNYRLLIDPSDHPFINSGSHIDNNYSAITLQSGQWSHVALTAQNIGADRLENVYINGAFAESRIVTGASVPDTSAFSTFLGQGEGGLAHELRGSLDDVRVYQGVLTNSEIAGLVAVPEPGMLTLAALGALGLVVAPHMRKHR
jgi:hypothetical protein